MHELIVSPFMGNYLVLRPGFPKGIRIPYSRYRELVQTIEDSGVCAAWFADAVRQVWTLEISVGR